MVLRAGSFPSEDDSDSGELDSSFPEDSEDSEEASTPESDFWFLGRFRAGEEADSELDSCFSLLGFGAGHYFLPGFLLLLMRLFIYIITQENKAFFL